MSVRERSVGVHLIPTTLTTVYTVPPGYYALWRLLYATNHTGINKKFSCYWFDASANTTYTIIDQYEITSTQFLKFDSPSCIVLEEGDQIKMQTETGSEMDAVITVELFKASSNQFA